MTKTAELMFFDMGYFKKVTNNNQTITYTTTQYTERHCGTIEFDNEARTIRFADGDNKNLLDIQQIIAINKQIEELGWKKNDDENG